MCKAHFFLLYVNDCEQHLPPGVKMAVYADDTTVYKCFPDRHSLPSCHADLQDAVTAISEWGESWRIKFEPTKSQAMVLSHHRPPWSHPSLQFAGTSVAEESSLKLLGVVFDRKLLFAQHLRCVALRASQRLYFLRRIAAMLNPSGRAKVYKGFVRPVLEYSTLVWMGASATALRHLDTVQRKALKIIHHQTWLPSLDIRRAVSALCYLYKLVSLPSSSLLKAVLPARADIHASGHHTRQDVRNSARHHYQLDSGLPLQACNSTHRSFPFSAVSLWNDLPAALLREAPSHKWLQDLQGPGLQAPATY